MRASAWLAPALALLVGCGDRVASPAEGSPVAAATDAASPADPKGSSTPDPPTPGDEGRGPHRPTPTDRSEPVPPPPPALPQTSPPADQQGLPRVRPAADRAAVVIGIDNYPGEGSDLTAAVADARVMRRTLARLGFGRMVVLVNGQATRDAVLGSARWLARRSGPGTLGAFFYAGHVRRYSGDPDGDGEAVDEAMATADGKLVFDGELAAALRSAAGPLWLAFASCYAAGFSDAAAPGRVASYASDEHSLAYESTALNQSFMVEYLVRRAMVDEGLTTVEEAHAYARQHLRGKERRFRPLIDDRLPGPLDLAPPPEPQGTDASRTDPAGTQTCLVVLRCKG